MKITEYMSDRELTAELGSRLKAIRIAVPMTQKELGVRAGVSAVTVSAAENGKEISLSSLIRIMRVLGLISNFETLAPEQGIRPSQLASLGKARERAVSQKKAEAARRGAWKWGDEE